jgi:ABC-type dipeptide/oligopeptide/nickel transport system permease subunit
MKFICFLKILTESLAWTAIFASPFLLFSLLAVFFFDGSNFFFGFFLLIGIVSWIFFAEIVRKTSRYVNFIARLLGAGNV